MIGDSPPRNMFEQIFLGAFLIIKRWCIDHLQLRSVAKDHRQKMTFVHLNVGNEENEGIAEFFGVTKVFEAS